MLTIIAAVTRDMGLGRQGQLLYPIPADLKHFKSLTMGHPIVMGRHTFESFPNGPLPGRRNLVISSNPDYSPAGVEVYHSLQAAIDAAGEDCFVIGGGRVYAEAMPMADALELTLIDAPSPASTDTYFPAVNLTDWYPVHVDDEATDPRSGVAYRFARFERSIASTAV